MTVAQQRIQQIRSADVALHAGSAGTKGSADPAVGHGRQDISAARLALASGSAAS